MPLSLQDRLKEFIKGKYPKAGSISANNVIDIKAFGQLAEVKWSETIDGRTKDFDTVVLMPKSGSWTECQDLAVAIQAVALHNNDGFSGHFNKAIGVHGLLALLLVGTICGIALLNSATISTMALPDWLTNPMMVVLGFYFGQIAPKVSQQS